MKITAVCLGQPEKLEGKSYKTGIFKTPVSGPVMVDAHGLVGDSIVNRKHHGGPDQAVYLEGSLTLDWWQEQLGKALAPGTFGENLVIEGLDNQDLAVGDQLKIGTVVLEVSAPRIPCATFSARMQDASFVKHYTRAARPGAYCRVLQGGLLETGTDVLWSASEKDRLLLREMIGFSFKSLPDAQQARYLAAPISERIRAQVTARTGIS
ncbi:MOSC domain-containing protein [Rhizobium oryziradicis]|uniref:Molybdenum cofactor biosysynthesis protein n=1 Tax=Rhizobium oryziradicis TaxID=1867956 RepID=A0A1Q8ZTU7_9HYPH|nr:MOSC domain-containing protein [Rhizobium oryziradicis]OLP45358.1 molybdenum cofactor biosysynthesis protein [Rhizobium oryziradicis]